MDIVFLIYEGMTALDAMGPWEVLARLPGARARMVSPDGAAIRTDLGVGIEPAGGIADVARADLLLIPGAGDIRPLLVRTDVVDWVRRLDASTTWTTSACTGALLLGAAGLLKGKRATTHWAAFNALAKTGATPVAERVVTDGKVVTAAGVSAGIDMALTLAARLADSDTAKALQLAIEYDPAPPFDGGSPAKASAEIRALAGRLLAARR